MSFLKSLFLAIFATLFLTYVLGISFIEFFNVDIYMDKEFIEPLQAISVSALIVVALVIAALAIVLSVFGTIIFALMLVCGGALMFTVGVFWPIFLIVGIIWLVTKDKKQVSRSY